MEKGRKVINSDLIKKLSSLGCRISKNESLSEHCSFKIGGQADFFVEIPNEQALFAFLSRVSSHSYFVLGKGTNVLFSDEGYRGIVVSLIGTFEEIVVLKDKISSGGGALLVNVLKTALDNDLTGLECMAGIPGTVGGAVYGNAGSADSWISEVITSVEVYKNFKKEVINKEKIDFGYRKSGLENCIITKVYFSLKEGIKNNSFTMVSNGIQKRLKTQPLNMPNAGSIFKNPAGFSVGRLIEKAGLKRTGSGGAQISELHGNFIVNVDGALAKDVLVLIDLIKQKIKEKFNIDLELEIKIIE